jgi:leucyl aminopeptidase
VRLEIREPKGSDVVVRLDPELEPGDDLRTAAALEARALRGQTAAIAWQAPTDDHVRAIVEGTAYGAYDPGIFKSGYEARGELTLVLDTPHAALAERQATIMRHLDASRDLANRPPNDLTPVALAEHAKSYASESLIVTSYGRDWIEEQGMGAFAGVAAGSGVEPQLIVMRYDPPDVAGDVLGLVGKAITFDSGGISLKPPLRMQDMKGDMCGGAAVIEATAAIAELGLPVRILTVVASTENVQDGRAFKPGDILRASNGKTIEIMNTDAEGRLILADALHYTRSNGAARIVDFATLTGAMALALGDLYAGWFCNDEPFAATIESAASASGEHAWRFPLHPRYRRYVDSDFADMKNGSELREGGPVLAAEFLREFTGEGPWAHFDIAGPAYLRRKRPDYALDQGGTGYGVRLIVELAEQFA